jgi:hypothetical protein
LKKEYFLGDFDLVLSFRVDPTLSTKYFLANSVLLQDGFSILHLVKYQLAKRIESISSLFMSVKLFSLHIYKIIILIFSKIKKNSTWNQK